MSGPDIVWHEYPGHFIGSPSCLFWRHTTVGKYKVSSVGDYFPHGKQERETVGCDRYFETYVFDLEADNPWTEIDAEVAQDAETCERNHMMLLEKYAALQGGTC